MPIRKALLSLLAKVPLLKGMNQPSLQQSSINDSREDLEASSRKIGYSKEGLDAKYKWIREHKAAIRVGKQLVQHEMHIVAQLLYIENLADEKGSLTPSHEDQILKYEAELKQINHEYMEYRERINELESYKPLGHMASQHLHLYGHRAYSQAWNMEAYWCRLSDYSGSEGWNAANALSSGMFMLPASPGRVSSFDLISWSRLSLEW
ncbi:uncharacterized protein N7473_006578 [Penicillium subrubescens]|uniref:uncharacterized protein n=1 Tax=Penicillium subrubescens TaxID=1316194 RepID=UPI002544E285|nr:uncharacterized protein N7473_006578 [Penicillium subrubescens]KAJ5890350.1 hypothetical protein N7473_006578 [Penicillium subrubescens]